MNVKRKGTAGENELSELLRQRGIRAYRNDQIYKGGKGNPDVFAEIGDQKLHVEVKRVEKLNVPEAVHQAEQWLVTLPLLPLLDTLKTGGIIHE